MPCGVVFVNWKEVHLAMLISSSKRSTLYTNKIHYVLNKLNKTTFDNIGYSICM